MTDGRGLVKRRPPAHAEVSIGFARIEEVDAALPLPRFRRLALPREAAFLAGKCLLARKRRRVRPSPLPDFRIGAHASLSGMTLLAPDAARHRGRVTAGAGLVSGGVADRAGEALDAEPVQLDLVS